MKFFNNKGKKYKLSKYFFLIIPILLAVGLFGYLQLKTYKANRLIECIEMLDINDIYAIDIYSKKDRYWNPEYKRFNGSKANDMLVLFKEQDYRYYNFMDKDDLYKGGNYNLGNKFFLEITTLDKKSLNLTLGINDDFNRALVIMDGDSFYNNSAVYKLPFDSGTELYNSLIKIAWEE